MKCCKCGRPVTWDNSYGLRNHLYCHECMLKKGEFEYSGDIIGACQAIFQEGNKELIHTQEG